MALFVAGIGVSVAWSWLDRTPPASGAGSDIVEFLRSEEQLRSLAAALRSAPDELRALSRRYELREIRTEELPEISPTCRSALEADGDVDEGSTIFHRLGFAFAGSPSPRRIGLTFTSCPTNAGDRIVAQHGASSWTDGATGQRAPRTPIARNGAELRALTELIDSSEGRARIASFLELGPIGHLEVRVSTLRDDEREAFGEATVYCSVDEEEPLEAHRFDFRLEWQSSDSTTVELDTRAP